MVKWCPQMYNRETAREREQFHIPNVVFENFEDKGIEKADQTFNA